MTNWRFYNEHENEKKYSYKSNNISNKHEIWNSIRIVLLIGFGLGLFKSDIFKSFFQHRTSPDNFNDLLYPKNKNLPLRQITPVNNSSGVASHCFCNNSFCFINIYIIFFYCYCHNS